MTLKNGGNFEERLTLRSNIEISTLVNLHPTTQNSKNFTLMGYFCPKSMIFELKKHRGVIFHGINPDHVVSKTI